MTGLDKTEEMGVFMRNVKHSLWRKASEEKANLSLFSKKWKGEKFSLKRWNSEKKYVYFKKVRRTLFINWGWKLYYSNMKLIGSIEY